MSPRIPGRPIITRASLLATAATLYLGTFPATAATKTWDGGGTNDNWLTGPNWNADTAPAANDILIFGGTVRPAPVNDFPAGTVFTGLSFAAGASAFNLTGNSIVLNRATIANNATNAVIVGVPVTLGPGNTTFTTPATGGMMTLSGAFARSTGSTVVVSRVGGNINFAGSGLANDATGILGGWAAIGNDWACLDGSGNTVPFTGYTNIPSGAIASGANLNYRYTADTANITAAAGTAINSLAATIGTNRNVTLSGVLRLGSRGGIYRTGVSTANSILTVTGGSLTATGGGEITLLDATTTAGNFVATSNNLRVDSAITDDGANPVAVNIIGYTDIRGTNTYTGGTFINLGRVQAAGISVFGTGPVNVYQGGQAFLNTGAAFANGFVISGTGTTEVSGGQTMGAIRMGGGSSLSGTITLAENARISGASGSNNTITGKITGPGRLEFTASTGNNGGITLNNAANDWSGGLLLTVGGATRQVYLKLGADEQIPDGPGKGSVTIAGTSDVARLDLSGRNETINGLNSAANAFNQVKNTLATPCTLTLGGGNANGDFGGTLDDAGAGAVSLVKIGTGTQILRGTTNYLGTTTVNGGRLEFVGDFNGTGAITVNSGGVLATNAQLTPDVTISTGGLLVSNPAAGAGITVKGNLNLGEGSAIQVNTTSFPVTPVQVQGYLNPTGGVGSVSINITGVTPAVGQYPLISYRGIGGIAGIGLSAFKLGTLPPRFAAQLYDDTLNQTIVLDVTYSGDFPIWSGAESGEWSTAVLGGAKNWVLNSNPGTITDYFDGEIDLFDDTAVGTTTLNISAGAVRPLEVRFNNGILDYVVTGSNGIEGTGMLTKNGGALVTLATNNSYTGQTKIDGGTLRIGNGGTSGTLGSGAVVDNAVLDFQRSDSPNVANVITGTGAVRQSGTGTLVLSGVNGYSGATNIDAGTLRVINSNSVGTLPGGTVTIADGAAFDLSGNVTANNLNFGQKPFVISGAGPAGHGAITNSGTVNQQNAFQRITLAADASIGGTGRLDIRATAVGGVNQSSLDLAGHTLHKVDANFLAIVNTDVSDGDIVVHGGTFNIEGTTNLGGSGTVTFQAGTSAQLFGLANTPSTITRPMVFSGNGSFIGNSSAAASVMGSPIELQGDVTLTALVNLAPGALTLGGNITESGGARGVTKAGTCTVILSGTNSYTGPTTVSVGTLLVNGSLGATAVTTAAGTTFGGAGLVAGPMTVGGTLAPGNAAIGALTAGNVTFLSGASLAIQMDSTTSASDALYAGSINLGGATLAVTDAGSTALAPGAKLLIAQYNGTVTGSFANVADGGTVVVGPNTFRLNTHDLVAGQNAITLSIPVGGFSPGYDSWATTMGLNSSNNAPDQDPDGDGQPNLLEFALAGNPLSSSGNASIAGRVLEIDPGTGVERVLTLTIPVRGAVGFSGPGDLVSAAVDRVIYTVQGSADFTDFTSMGISEVTPAAVSGLPTLPGGWNYRTFRAPGNVTSSSKAFLRVKVSEAP